MSAQPFEIRLARLEGTYEQVDKRLDTIHADVRDLRTAMTQRFNNIDARFNWLIGIVVTGVFAIISVIAGFSEYIANIIRHVH